MELQQIKNLNAILIEAQFIDMRRSIETLTEQIICVLPFLVICNDCYWNIQSNTEDFLDKIEYHTHYNQNDEHFRHEQFDIIIK